MEKLTGKFKKIVSLASITSLLQTPIVYAQGDVASQNNPTKRATEVMDTMTNGIRMYSQFLQVNNQQRLQQIQNQQLQKQLSSLSPTVVPSKMFPECAITPSMSNSVKDFCYAEASVNAVNSNNQMKQLADSWINTLNKILNTASNGQTEIGILCLQNRQKSLDDNFQELINNLTRLEQQLNAEKENFRKLNASILDQMKTLKSELSGGAEGTNLDTKTKDYTSLFSKECQTIIANGTTNLSKAGGLMGISTELAVGKKRANDHNQNKLAIEKEIRRDVQKAVDHTKKYGIGGLNTFNPNETQYKALTTKMTSEALKFNVNYERIKAELKNLEYELPALDKNFTVDLNEFTTQAKDFFKKRYINKCVTGADKTGVALSTDQVLGALRQKSTNNKGTAAAQYRVALENIINSDAFIQDKVNQIKALENNYKDISITYRSSNGQSVTSSPYDLYIKQINLCEQQYASSNAATSSEKKKVDRGVSLLNELQNLNNNFTSNFTTNALDALLNCNGNSAKNGLSKNSCADEAVFDFTSDNYCLSIANTCANTIVGCDAELTNQITIRKNKQKALAATYNTNMQNMITKANTLVKAQNAAVIAMMKKIQAKLPGTNIDIPQDILIETPALLSKNFDVALLGDGNLGVMDEINKKLAILKDSISNQRGSTKDAIAEYIQKQDEAARAELKKWGDVYTDCSQKEQDSSAMIAQMNQDGMKKQAEEDAKVGSFCRKYGALRNNPMAGCGGSLEKLTDTAAEIAAFGRLSKNADHSLNQYAALCAQVNNEDETKYENAKKALKRCRKGKDNDCDDEEEDVDRTRSKLGKKKDDEQEPKTYADFCKNKDTNDTNLIKALANLSKDSSVKNKLAKMESLEKFKKEAEESNLKNYEDFFETIEDEIGSDVFKNPGFCSKLYSKLYPKREISGVNSSPEILTQKVVQLKKDKMAAEEQLKTAQTDAVKTANKDAFTKAESDLKIAEEELNKAQSNSKEEIDKKIAEAINNGVKKLTEYTTPQERLKTAFNNIGEQTTNDCDTQLSTTASTNKGMDFLRAFDASILGSSKAK